MFKLFNGKKQESFSVKPSPEKENQRSSRTPERPTFEINADFGGVNGWPADASTASYLSTPGLICSSTEAGALMVHGKSYQYYRPRPVDESACVKNIMSVAADMCLVVYHDNSLAVFRLPQLELLDSVRCNWLTNSAECDGIELTCVHVDEFAEKNQRAFVYIGTSLGDVNVIEISTISGSIRICDYSISCRDVEIAAPMKVTSITSDEKCLMIGYEASKGANETNDKDSDDSSSCPSSPRNEHPQRFDSFIGEIPTPAAVSRCLGIVVVFNITKRRVRHSYVTTSGVKFLLMDGAGAVLYAVLRNGEMLSLTACSGKSLSLSVWSLTASNEDDNYDESDIEPVVKQVRWMSPQSASANTAIGCCLLLLNDNRLICLSPSGAQGKMTEITTFGPLDSEEITDFHIVPLGSNGADIEQSGESTSSSSLHASAGLLLVTKKVPSDDYCRQYRNEKGRILSIQSERYRVSSASQAISRGCYLRVIACPSGLSTIPTVMNGSSAIEVAVAIAVAITESSPPPSVGKEKSTTSSLTTRVIGLPFADENALTSISALIPCESRSSMAAILLLNPVGTSLKNVMGSRRAGGDLSPRIKPFSEKSRGDEFSGNQFECVAEVILADKERNLRREYNSAFDLVFLGQKNGSLTVWASSPSAHYSQLDQMDASDRDQNQNTKSYHAGWRHLRTFNCLPNCGKKTASNGESSPSSSPFNNSVSIFFPTHSSAQSADGNVYVSSICPDDGAGLFSAGTSNGDVTVWEVFQRDCLLGCVEHTARTYAGRPVESSVSGSTRSLNNSPTPDVSKMVLSWEDDSDEDDDDDLDDDEDDEDVIDDKAVVYDIRKLNSTAITFKTQLLKHQQKIAKAEHRKSINSSKTSSKGTASPDHSVKTQELKINLFSKVVTSGRDDVENPGDYLRNAAALFQPDDIRIAFRAKVTGIITAQLLLSDLLILAVGTSAGGVWVSRGLNESSMTAIDLSGMWKVSTKSPGNTSINSEVTVTAMHYSLYWNENDSTGVRDVQTCIPVLYIMFSCGNIAVICLQTLTMLAYCLTEESTEMSGLQSILKKRVVANGKKETSRDGGQRDNRFSEYDSDGEDSEGAVPKAAVAFAVTDASYTDISPPTHKASYCVRRSYVDGHEVRSFSFIALNGTGDFSPYSEKSHTARGDSSSDRSDNRNRSRSNSDAYSSGKNSQYDNQSTSPRYLVVAIGASLVTYDISKFCKLSTSVGRPRRSFSVTSYNSETNDSLAEVTFTNVRGGVQSSQVISGSSLIAGKHLIYADKSTRTTPSSSLTLISAYGKMPTISLKEKSKLCDDDLFQKCGDFKLSCVGSPSKDSRHSRNDDPHGDDLNAKEKNMTVPFNSSLKTGIILSNGSVYLLQKNGLLLFYNYSDSNTHLPNGRIPSRVPKNVTLVPSSLSLYENQLYDARIVNYQNAFRTKQTSLFGVIGTVHSGPADLVKLFVKSRDPNYRKEKIKMEKKNDKSALMSLSNFAVSKDENERASDRQEKDAESGSHSPGNVQKKSLFASSVTKEKSVAGNAKANAESLNTTMAEVHKNLVERGEKLSNLNNQAGELNQGANHFRDLVKLHKQELQKKAGRWGL